jgi:hypothetical protein
LPLAELARELGVHIRTLQVAAQTGRLKTQFSARTVFGRPMRFASRDANSTAISGRDSPQSTRWPLADHSQPLVASEAGLEAALSDVF